MYNVELSVEKREMTEDEKRALIEDLRFFCNTPKGNLPLNREFGFDHTIADEPFERLRMRATVDIVTGARKFFGINLTQVKVTANENGETNIKVTV